MVLLVREYGKGDSYEVLVDPSNVMELSIHQEELGGDGLVMDFEELLGICKPTNIIIIQAVEIE